MLLSTGMSCPRAFAQAVSWDNLVDNLPERPSFTSSNSLPLSCLSLPHTWDHLIYWYIF